MNRRLQKKLKESVVEQRGWHWALTSFALEAYGDSNEKVLGNGLSDTELSEKEV